MDDRAGVRATYDRIAAYFAETRHHPWPEVRSFLEGRDGQLGLDVGCGNGRHVALLADHADRVVGLDASRELLNEARARGEGASWVAGDAARLPVRDGRIDLAIYVATIHHLPERAGRVASLDELGRVLAPVGRGLVSAWSVDHDRFDAEAGFDTTVDWTLPDGETVPRFYHIYDHDEFAADLASAGLTVVESFVSSGNCYAVVSPGTGST
jgi:ubiquinone/menaquinone biosynthesis C-methylase UbiE